MVKRQTSDTAAFFGFHDRGLLQEGMKADVNVFDYEGLKLHVPEVRYDLPMNGRRLVQRADGYKHTFVVGRLDVRERHIHRRHARQARAGCTLREACGPRSVAPGRLSRTLRSIILGHGRRFHGGHGFVRQTC